IVSGICISIFGVIVTASFNAPTILASLAKDHEDVPIQVAMEHYKISAINFVGYSSGATGVINYMMETSKDKNYPPVANFISLDGEYNSCKYGYKKQELSHIMTSAPDKKTAMYRYIEANYQKLNPKIRVYLMEGNNLTKSGQLTDGTIPWGDSFSIYHLLQKNGNPVSIYIYPTKVAHSLLPKEKTVQNYIKNLLY
ncbi:MAG: alpha/beta hydrolase, partial [Streptococcaceae bacterium]|nr:alpha/beta hydrolase [Streptococcaceae bacterium]